MISSIILCFYLPGFSLSKTNDVKLTIQDDGIYKITGGFNTSAPISTVWDVLTDYEDIQNFISFVQASKIKSKNGSPIILEQEAKGHFWFFSKSIHVMLQINEDPLKAIHFEDLAQKDFQMYKGSWTIELDQPNQINVQYQLNAIKKFYAPEFIAKTVFRENVQAYLAEVEKEIFRRSQLEEDLKNH